VGDGDLVAVRLQATGDGEADSAVSAGDEDGSGGDTRARGRCGTFCVSHAFQPIWWPVRYGKRSVSVHKVDQGSRWRNTMAAPSPAITDSAPSMSHGRLASPRVVSKPICSSSVL